MTAAISIVTAILAAWIMYDIGRSRGYAKGYTEGYELAKGWRDEAIEKWAALAKEALRQRDEARSTQAHKPPPNPFAYKDLN